VAVAIATAAAAGAMTAVTANGGAAAVHFPSDVVAALLQALVAAQTPAAPVQQPAVPEVVIIKGPRNSFNFFTQHAPSEVKGQQAMAAMQAAWQDMTVEQKAPYAKMALDDKERVAKEKSAATAAGKTWRFASGSKKK
jgi:hypothetical protein